MKRLLLVVMLVLCTNLVNAQSQKESVIKLKSGIEISGTIVEHTNTSIAIKDNNGDTFFYNMHEVVSINGKNINKKQSAVTSGANSGKRGSNGRGYGGKIEFYGGYGIVEGSYDLSFTAINGYHFGPSFYLGAGVGVKVYGDYQQVGYYYALGYPLYDYVPIVCMPIFLYCQCTFMKGRKVRPYISLGVGGNIAFTLVNSGYGGYDYGNYNDYGDYYGDYRPHGFFLEPSVGLSVKLKSSMALNFAITSQMNLMNTIGLGAKVGFSF